LPDSELEHLLAGDLTLNTQGLMSWLARSGAHGTDRR
jgi:hypothetical protein